MINITNVEDCCGCNACGDICPKSAITFVARDGGFLYPKVNVELCIGCNKCETVCPVFNHHKCDDPRSDVTAFGGAVKDLNVRFRSTSGGIFTLLAEHVLAQGGCIGGAVWDESFNVHHILVDSREGLSKLRESKYSPSNAVGFYKSVATELHKGRKVLVCALPCQIAAMRRYLKDDAENLLLVDLFCRSLPSPYLVKKYVDHISTICKSRVIELHQKDKGLGWRSISMRCDLSNGESYFDPKDDSLFMRLFESDACSRPSCYACKFKGFPRPGDISIGDCWGAACDLPREMDHDLGLSAILCNTPKGRAVYDAIVAGGKFVSRAIDINHIVNGNQGLTRRIICPNIDRDKFFSDLEKLPLQAVVEKYASTAKISRMRKIRRIIGRVLLFARTFRLWQAVSVNGWRRILSGAPLVVPNGRLLFLKGHGSSVIVNKDTYIGNRIFPGSKLESRIRLFKNAMIKLNGGSIGPNCHIMVFEDGCIEIGKACTLNIGTSMTCAQSIKIGNYVAFGRHVSVRDTHGDHFIDTPDYKATAPVEIGDHVWICSHSIIMPGVKIGSGSIVGAYSLVNHDVPPNCLVAGIPARIIRKDIRFKV